MRLDMFFCSRLQCGKLEGDYELKVIGNGNGLTNVPKGAKGEIISVKGSTYTIKWSNGIVEQKDVAGGMAMDLNVVFDSSILSAIA